MPASLEQKLLLGKLKITSNILVETGIHIGGGAENLDIGGLDKPVIRDPLTQAPYLPGSSLKGKLRSILERLHKKPLNRPGGSGVYIYSSDDLEDGYTDIKGQLIRYEGAKDCEISRLFGSTGGSNCWIDSEIVKRESLDEIANVEPRKIHTKEHRFADNEEGEDIKLHTKVKGRNSPARLIVRDCHLDDNSADRLKKVDTGLYMTEWKFENSIDRITAAANPRQFERVPRGSIFNFEMVYTVEDTEQAVEDLKNLAIALVILEDDALGGHGSRGYGKIRFTNLQLFYRNLSNYQQMQLSNEPIQAFEDTSSLLSGFENLTNEIQQRLLASRS